MVLRLCAHLPKNKNYKIYFDNYFTYIELLIKLKEHQFWAVGTLRKDRMRKCKLKGEKELKKTGRGSFEGAIDKNSGTAIVRWLDNKMVQLASNYVFTEPADTVNRWSKKERKMIDVPRPHIIKVYNSAMGGVDLFDMFQSLYRLDHKSKRWYLRVFYWIISSSVINGWLLYRKHFDVISSSGKKNCLGKDERCKTLIQFTSEVAQSLISNARHVKKKRGRPSLDTSLNESFENVDQSKKPRRAPDLLLTPDNIRLDEVSHWPVHREDRPRCFVCKQKTRLGCLKCGKGLCLVKERNCFLEYHEV